MSDVAQESAPPISDEDHLETPAERVCRHCGTEFLSHSPDHEFCCSGCEYVFRLISKEDLSRYYDLKDGPSQPVGSAVFAENDFSWLDALLAESASGEKTSELRLGVSGISCVGCVWLIDRLFSSLPGAISCQINPQRASICLLWRAGELDLKAFARKLQQFGYALSPLEAGSQPETSSLAWRLGLCAAFALNSMLYTLPGYLGMDSSFAFAKHFAWLSALFATGSMAAGGSYFLIKAAAALRARVIDLDLPISIGLVIAYLVSWYGFYAGSESLVYFDFVSTFVFLMLIGRWLRVHAIERNRRKLARFSIEPPRILLESQPHAVAGAISATELAIGQRYWLRPGQMAPVDSRLLSTRACLGTDWINGESETTVATQGQEISSGASLQGQDAVKLEAIAAWDQSLLKRLRDMDTTSRERDAVLQRWIAIYLKAVLILATLGGLAWLAAGQPQTGLGVFIAVLVVSCPCALGIALPLIDEIALAKLKNVGVFLRTHSLWNRLRRLTQVAFDKTGTLTRSSLSLQNPGTLHQLDAKALQALSALCQSSRHPVARNLRERLMAKGLFQLPTGVSPEETVGSGLAAMIDGQRWQLGRAAWISPQAADSGTALAVGGEIVTLFHFGDHPRSDASRVCNYLRQRDLSIAILSGDRQSKASEAARSLGVDREHALGELSPQQKADWLARHDGAATLMVGDGANDSLAFESALCCGTPASEQAFLAERSDFYYLGDGLRGIEVLLRVADQRRFAVRVVVAFAIVYNIGAAAIALAGIMTPLFAAILMPLSSIASLALSWLCLGRP